MLNPNIKRILYREEAQQKEFKEYTILKKWEELSITEDQYIQVDKAGT